MEKATETKEEVFTISSMMKTIAVMAGGLWVGSYVFNMWFTHILVLKIKEYSASPRIKKPRKWRRILRRRAQKRIKAMSWQEPN